MKAEQLRKSILQLAIQGKLVPQDPNDEPASVLLEHIREEKQRMIKEGKIKKDKIDSFIYKGEDNRYYEKVGPEVKDITDDLPFEIPNSWVWCRFAKLIKIISGVSYDKKDVTTNGVRILRGGNINDLKISLFTDDIFLPEKYYDDEKQVQENDIIIVASTGSKSVIGKAGYILAPMNNTQIGAFLRIVRCLDKIIAPYTKIIFATEYYREHIRQLSQGTNINNVKAEYINNLLIPLPPLAEQARIVTEIEKFEPLIAEYDKLEQQATKLDDEIYDKLKKSILQYAIQGKLVPQDPNDEPASILLERIRAEKKAKLGKKYVDSYIYKGDDNCYYEHFAERTQDKLVEIPFDLPNGWALSRIATISDSYIGLTYKPTDIVHDGGNIVLRSSNIKDGKIDLEDIVRVSSNIPDKLKIRKNDIVICARNGSKKLVGKSAIVDLDAPNLTFGAFMAICRTPLFNYTSKFLQSACFFEQLASVSGTTTINQLTQANFNSFFIPIPPIAEQKRIVARINEIFAML